MLNNNFTNLFTQWFDKPKQSVFNVSKPVSFDMEIGKMYPSFWTICGFGDSAKGKSNHKMRLMPMVAPNFADLRYNEHTAVVPLRVIMRDYEAKFNYAKNRDGAQLPVLTVDNLVSIYKAMGKLGYSPVGSLFDFLGFPVFGDVYKSVTLGQGIYYPTGSPGNVAGDAFYIPTYAPDSNAPVPSLFSYSFSYRGVDYSSNVTNPDNLLSFFAYIMFYHKVVKMPVYADNLDFGYSLQFFEWINAYDADLSVDAMTQFLSWINDDLTVVSAVNEYYAYLFGQLLYKVLDNVNVEKNYTLLPVLAYHRFVADWSIVSNVTDPDTYLEKFVYSYKTNLLEYANRLTASGGDVDSLTEDELNDFVTMVTPKARLWDLDYFTSQLPTSAQGNDIVIPANSTVIDLASLTAFQKFIMKLSFNSRYRDVVWNVFNIRPSDARLQQSSVIQSNEHFVQIGETLQTSETTVSSVLGSFGGRAFSAGSKKGYHIFCEEPCVVISFSSLIAKPQYMDALHPLIHIDDIFDFPIPDMDVLGNQPQYTDLLTGNPNDTSVFGYARQYMEWIGNYGTVHNNMKTSLDYWTLARRFDSTPALNEEFLTINPKDDFDRIFSVPDSSHAALDVYHDVKVTRPIHRSVRIIV